MRWRRLRRQATVRRGRGRCPTTRAKVDRPSGIHRRAWTRRPGVGSAQTNRLEGGRQRHLVDVRRQNPIFNILFHGGHLSLRILLLNLVEDRLGADQWQDILLEVGGINGVSDYVGALEKAGFQILYRDRHGHPITCRRVRCSGRGSDEPRMTRRLVVSTTNTRISTANQSVLSLTGNNCQ